MRKIFGKTVFKYSKSREIEGEIDIAFWRVVKRI